MPNPTAIPTTPPASSCSFFSTSSLWILFLATQAHPSHPALPFLLITTAGASFYHWQHYAHHSPAGVLDRLASTLTFGHVALHGNGTAHHMLIAGSLASLALGHRAMVRRRWARHLFFHALFRCLAFWMIHNLLRGLDAATVVLFTAAYSLHWAVSWLWCMDELMFATRKAYAKDTCYEHDGRQPLKYALTVPSKYTEQKK